MKHVILFVLVFTLPHYAIGQAFCFSDQDFEYPDIALRAGIQPSFLVRFDITGFIPKNFRVFPADSTTNDWVKLFRPSIINNLERMTYFSDSLDFEIKVRYKIRPFKTISTNYIEALSDNEIQFVARPTSINIRGDLGTRLPDPNIDSVFLEAFVQYKSGTVRPSDIIVERLFENEEGKSVILRNNYPDLEDDIYSSSASFSKEKFLSVGSTATRYFIRFRIERNLPGCRYKRIY